MASKISHWMFVIVQTAVHKRNLSVDCAIKILACNFQECWSESKRSKNGIFVFRGMKKSRQFIISHLWIRIRGNVGISHHVRLVAVRCIYSEQKCEKCCASATLECSRARPATREANKNGHSWHCWGGGKENTRASALENARATPFAQFRYFGAKQKSAGFRSKERKRASFLSLYLFGGPINSRRGHTFTPLSATQKS